MVSSVVDVAPVGLGCGRVAGRVAVPAVARVWPGVLARRTAPPLPSPAIRPRPVPLGALPEAQSGDARRASGPSAGRLWAGRTWRSAATRADHAQVHARAVETDRCPKKEARRTPERGRCQACQDPHARTVEAAQGNATRSRWARWRSGWGVVGGRGRTVAVPAVVLWSRRFRGASSRASAWRLRTRWPWPRRRTWRLRPHGAGKHEGDRRLYDRRRQTAVARPTERRRIPGDEGQRIRHSLDRRC